MNKRAILWAPLLAACGVAAGCIFPDYHKFTSPFGDFTCEVPYGWSVKTDREDDHFTNVTFIGGFDTEFYLGAPSISIRWHASNRIHKLPNGLLEMYSDVDDYTRQMLRSVYGPTENKDYFLGAAKEKQEDSIHVINLKAAKIPAKYFVVTSPIEVPAGWTWGVSVDKKTKGKSTLIRKHAYVLVPMKDGFYVIVYPATLDGYEKYEKQFRVLLGTFKPLTEGLGGPAFEVPKSAR
ncbi:MAG: hypothetical protein HZB91_04585 [Elusimicrobia bacterium]|nr:hypothetical protein [Elusimicrobiota bacterium]